MLLKILAGIAALLVVIAILASFQPATYRVERSATMNAAPAVVFAQANDLHLYNNWNPFGKDDKTTVLSYDGPTTGPGAVMRWKGNSAGEGQMTIADTKPAALVHYRLAFVKPFAGEADASITINPLGNQSVVTWSMEGKNTFIGKLFGLFMSMDKMIGDPFTQGLAALKAIVEKAPA